MAGSVMAQKMVIGSRVPDFKGVQWMTTMPHTSETPEAAPMLIEFYNPDNASSVRFFSKLAGVKERHPKIQIVVLVARNKQSAEQLLVAWVQSELLLPERFLYKGENLYYHIVMEEEP